MRVTPFDEERYRGFQLGWTHGLHGYLAAWRSSLDDKWGIGHVYVDDLADCLRLAKKCIDFNYAKDAEEFDLGRRMTIQEMTDWHKQQHKGHS